MESPTARRFAARAARRVSAPLQACGAAVPSPDGCSDAHRPRSLGSPRRGGWPCLERRELVRRGFAFRREIHHVLTDLEGLVRRRGVRGLVVQVQTARQVLGRVDQHRPGSQVEAPERVGGGLQGVPGGPDRVVGGEGVELETWYWEDLLEESPEPPVELISAAARLGEDEAAPLDVLPSASFAAPVSSGALWPLRYRIGAIERSAAVAVSRSTTCQFSGRFQLCETARTRWRTSSGSTIQSFPGACLAFWMRTGARPLPRNSRAKLVATSF